MLKLVRFAAAPALMACLLAAAVPARAQDEQRIVVLVNDDPISAYDVEQREHFLQLTTHKPASPELRKQAIDMLIDEQLELQAGKDMKVFPDEGDVDKVVAGMAAKNHATVPQLTAALAHLGVNIDTLKDRIRAQLVWQDVVRQKFQVEINVGQTDIDQAMAGDNKVDLAAVTTVQVKKVRFGLPAHASQADIARRIADADALRQRFRTCGSVELLAKTFSVPVTPLTVKASAIPQPARTLLLNADIGDMVAPTIGPGSIDLYALCGKDTETTTPVERDTAERELMEKQMKVKAEQYLRDLRQDAYIDYRK